MSTNQITLRPMTEADLELKVKWANDDVINEYVGFDGKVTLEGTQKWFAAQSADPRITLLTVMVDGKEIGFAKLIRDEEGNSAEYNGLVIEPELWGRGIGKATSRMIIQHAFEVDKYDRLWAYFFPFNVRSIELHKKFGFHHIGDAPFTKYHPGHKREYQMLLYEVWRSDWEAAMRLW